MKYLTTTLFTILCAGFLAACGGGGSEDKSQDVPKITPPTINNDFCSPTLIMNGYVIDTAKYDTNNDDCLSDAEIEAAKAKIDAEKEQQEQESQQQKEELEQRTATGEIIEGSPFDVSFTKASVVGNAETISGRAQIHTNMLNGKFQINFSVFPSLDEGDEIVLGFSNGTAAQVLGGVEGILISEHQILVSKLSIFTTTINCTYSNDFNFDCEMGGIAIDTINASDVFDTVPIQGNIVIFSCNEIKGCYPNHATIPIQLN